MKLNPDRNYKILGSICNAIFEAKNRVFIFLKSKMKLQRFQNGLFCNKFFAG